MSDRLRQFIHRLGPGVITGASDDDPSGIATYSQAGARYGFSLLWLVGITTPLMISIQSICALIGRVTGKGLTAAMKDVAGKKLTALFTVMLLTANIINIGADIAAIAEVLRILIGGELFFWAVIVTLLSVLLQVFIRYTKYVRILRFFCLFVLSYAVVVMMIEVDWLSALERFIVPEIHWTRDYLMMIVAVQGTTISPYLFYWQASEEAEEEEDDPNASPLIQSDIRDTEALMRIKVDTTAGMALSNIIAAFIIISTAVTLHAHGITKIDTAAEAALALKPLAGDYAFLLFALGIIGTGLLALPVLAGSAAYAVGELAGKPVGLEKRASEAKTFYGVLTAAMIAGLAITLLKVNIIEALFYTAVINGVAAAPIMIITMIIASRQEIMGSYTIPIYLKIGGWTASLLMLVAAVAMFF